MLLALRKRNQHRWDRLLWDETTASVAKDWKREDRNLLEEDEVELPRARNIRQFTLEELVAAASESVVVVATRFPWCTECEEKDKAFVKATKKLGEKQAYADMVFGAMDLREQRSASRKWNVTCRKNFCPVLVFKPDEPVDEPYEVEMQLLYEMDEYAMMTDPMAGAPGHTPRGQSVKPNFDRFESDLNRLLPPALTVVKDIDELLELRRRWHNVVVSVGVNETEMRRSARRLRGEAAFALASDTSLLSALATYSSAEEGASAALSASSSSAPAATTGVAVAIELWASDATLARTPVRFDGQTSPLDAEGLEHFVRVHMQPLAQNYSWELKSKFEAIGLVVPVLWVNYSDVNNTNVTQKALRAFEGLCDRRRGTDARHHVLCCVEDESYSYYQREFGSHEPYPYPFFGLTTTLGYGDGQRYAYPFREPANQTAKGFFGSTKNAIRQMDKWVGRVLAGRVHPSHESGAIPAQGAEWVRGEVQEVVWKTYQKEVNTSTADVLLELYDNQRKKAHVTGATLRMTAAALRDYSTLKVARMETSQNFVPAVFGRKQFSKETEYYWVPPSLTSSEWTPEPPVRYAGGQPVTAERLLRFLKKYSLAHWSLKESLEVASDLSPEVLGQAQVEQRQDDRAEEEKQEMIQNMMSTLKKEKGLVDVGEMMGLKKAAETMEAGKSKDEQDSKNKKKAPTKPADPPGAASPPASKRSALKSPASGPAPKSAAQTGTVSEAEAEKRREAKRKKLKREEEKLRKLGEKEKAKKKQRREADKRQRERKQKAEAEAKAREAEERERKRKKQEKLRQERAMAPTTPFFSWGQSKEQITVSVSVPNLNPETVNVTLVDDMVTINVRDERGRSFILEVNSREFIVVSNSTWAVRFSEEKAPKPDGLLLTLHKAVAHRWDRFAQNHAVVKPFMRKDWVQDDGDVEEEEDVDLPSGTNIKRVTAGKLADLAAANSMVLAALRFPWCDKCVEKDRHFAQAARTIKEKEHLGGTLFAVVDVREEKYLGRTHNATCDDRCDILIFKQDEPNEPYVVPGRRYSEEIQIDCYKHLLPVVSEVADRDTFDRVTSAFDTAIVGFFKASKASDPWYSRFRAVARQLRGHALFGAIFDNPEPRDFGIDRDAAPSTSPPAPAGAGLGPGPPPGEGAGAAEEEEEEEEEGGSSAAAPPPLPSRPLVLLFKPKEQRHVEFTGDLTLEKLTHFSKVLSLPLLSPYNFEDRQKYQELKVPLGMMWLDGERPERKENARAKEMARRLALRFSGHLVFVLLNSTRDGLLMRPMALDPRRVPSFGIAATDELESSKFGFDMEVGSWEELRSFWVGAGEGDNRSYDRLEAFCASFLDGTLEQSHESSELPPTYRWPGPGSVHEVVWKTFRGSVYRTEHDVLLELYSPFRPQHRTYATVLDLVAEAVSGLASVKVARMDTANNYVLPEFGLSDKEKASTFYFLRAAPELHRRPKRFGGKAGKAEALPEKLLRFLHRETRGHLEWDLGERVAWVNREAQKRIKRLRALEKDYEKKMQDEWMQKEMEEFERYKRLGKFDNLDGIA